jgi:multidrug resistance efflux pump
MSWSDGARRVGKAIVWPLRALARGLRRAIGAFSFWVLAAVGLLALLLVYYALADRRTPLTTDAYIQAYVVQVAPQVAGQVVQMAVREGQQVEAGALLFALDPRPFEHAVARLRAKLAEAQQAVRELDADLAAARADRTRSQADADYAAAVFRQEEQIFRSEATTERRYLEALQRHKASQATVAQNEQAIHRAEDALAARIGEEHALVAGAKAELAEAELNLSYARVTAPCSGVITNLQLREGAYVRVGEPALALIDTSQWRIVANFRENSLGRLQPGQPALVALAAAPGRLLHARVETVGWGVGQGQGIPSGVLPQVERETSWVRPSQRFQVRLLIEDPAAPPLRVGQTGSVSVYTEADGALAGLTRAWHTVLAWLYYL